jgi:hypothetical protein
MNENLFKETFRLSDDSIAALNSDRPIDRELFLLRNFRDHNMLILNIITSYGPNRGVKQAEIDRFKLNEDYTGSFTAKFNVSIHHGCMDLTYDQSDSMAFTYSIDLENTKVTLIGQPPRERTTLDEF